MVKNPPASAGVSGVLGSIPGSGRSPGGKSDNPLQYSCLENRMDRRGWRAAVHGLAKELDITETTKNAHMHVLSMPFLIQIYSNPIYFLLYFWKSYSFCLYYNTTISIKFFLCLHLLRVSPTEKEAANCQKLLYSHLSSPAMTSTMVSTCEFSVNV